jgi:Tfp pilus assembly protein FimT
MRDRSRLAFSIFEMVLVLAIITFLAGLALPRMANATARYQADYAAKRLVHDLDRCRNNARLTAASQSITFDTTNSRYTVTGGSGTAVGFTVDLSVAPYKAKIVSASNVTFDAYGQAPSSGATITISSGGQTRTVTLSASSGKATWN